VNPRVPFVRLTIVSEKAGGFPAVVNENGVIMEFQEHKAYEA